MRMCAACFSMLGRRHLWLQHTNRLAPQFTWKLAGTPLAQRPAGFPSLYPAPTNWRPSVSPRDIRLSGLRRSRPAAQRTAERDAVFRFVPEQTGGAVRPSSDSQKEAPKETCHQMKPRKEEEPSSTAAHSPTRTPHRTPHIQNSFRRPSEILSLRPCAGHSAQNSSHAFPRSRPPPLTISMPPHPTAVSPLGGAMFPRSTTAARRPPAAAGHEPVALRARPTQPAFSLPPS